ncbi:cysteinyl leukotriene receptor 1-like [Lineus longissimus]|uniref:cysteinyl leukotriene receptor 1-like n=1 Tax=Lineus longissimus TaxID=88925 RepID=UPI00315D9E02
MENITTTHIVTDANSPDYPFLLAFYKLVSHYLWVIPVAIGVPGNIIAILVTNRRHNRGLSACIYMKAMAIADTLVLIQYAFALPIMYWDIGKSIVHMRDVFFIFHHFVAYTYAMLSGFFLTEMSVDRLIAVRFPMATTRLCTASRAVKTVIITTVLVVLYNIQIPFVMAYFRDSETGAEALVFHVPEYPFAALLASLGQTLLGTFIPFVIILGSNIIIIITVKIASEKRAQMRTGQGQVETNQKQEQHLTRMLIFVSCAYAVTSLPFRLFIMLLDVPAIGDMYDMENIYWNLRYTIQAFFLLIIWMFNYAVNFYLYCIGGGAKYRNDAKEVCKPLISCFTKLEKAKGN